MAGDWTVDRAATELLRREDERVDGPPITDEWPELDLETAYAVQDETLKRRLARGETLIGVKPGLTSRAKQQRMGIDEPLVAWLTDAMALPAGDPVPQGSLIHPRVEPEIVFVMRDGLSGPGVTASQAIAAVATLQAQIAAGLAPPTFSLSIAANLKLIAELQARLGGIQALLDLSLGIKLQGLNIQAALALALGLGPVALYGASGQPLSALLTQISNRDYLTDAGLAPSDTVDALLLVSKAPGFYAAAGVLFLMPPA